MPYSSLRDFIDKLEKQQLLVRVKEPVSTILEMTEIQTRVLAESGPALLFENVITENGNYLLDVWFGKWPGLSTINPLLKSITGIVETSLFYNLVNKAIIAGKEGIKILERNKINKNK